MIDRITWLGMLAKLGTPADPVKALQAMEAYLPFLAELPDAAFTLASLEHVAMTPKRLHIPDLSEVKGPLSAWWRDNRPARTALLAPAAKHDQPRAEPTLAEREAVARTMRTYLGQVAPVVTERAPVRAHPAPPIVLAAARARLARGNG
ncbi:MAG: hypothetical protein CK529_13770 [Rhodospirillaceae bacterium]|nr:MAG: hypothetical protein CK529_13770 [Rhodospirillaceae bacterium]